MAGGGYRGNLAAAPLRNTCVRALEKGQKIKIKSRQDQQLREQARFHIKQIVLPFTTQLAER